MDLVFNSPPLAPWNDLLIETRGFKFSRWDSGHQILYLNNVFRTDLEICLFPWIRWNHWIEFSIMILWTDIYSWKKENIHDKNEIKLRARGFSLRNFPQIITASLVTFCISSCVGFVKWSCFGNTHVKSTLCTRVSRHRGVHSYFNRRRVLMVWGCQKDTLIHLSPFAAYLCDMPRLTLGARLRAIGMLQGSTIQADLANRHTVSSLWTHYQDTGLSHDQPRSGPPRVTSQRQDV